MASCCTRVFRLPKFPLAGLLYDDLVGGSPIGVPRPCRCQIEVAQADVFRNATSLDPHVAPIFFLIYFPLTTPVKDGYCAGTDGDILEQPVGGGIYYRIYFEWIFGKGFENQHIRATANRIIPSPPVNIS